MSGEGRAARRHAAPMHARGETVIVMAVHDDAFQSCPRGGGCDPRPQGRARRHRRVERARASRVRHRPFVAPQPATISQVAKCGGDRGAAWRSARWRRHRAVSAALGRRPSLFHRGRAPYGWTWGGSDAAPGRRSGRGRARLPRHPSRSAHDQPRRDLALPQERLPAICSSSRLLRGWRRCVAFREAARPQPARARARTALFSPDHRIHLRAGLHHDGAGLGRSKIQAGGRLRVPALARSHHHLHELGTGRLRALRDGGALKRRGLEPEVYVSRPGPYFLDTAKSADKRRAMQVTQLAFQREAKALDIPSHLTPVNESVLMRAFDAGSVVIVLVSGYHMVPRGKPHWIFAFGRDGRHVLMHDPAAIRDDQGMAAAAETYAVPWTALERVTHLGRERLSAAIVIRKGPS